MLNLRNLSVTFLQGIFEYLLLFPVFLLIGIYMVNHLQLWMWIGSLPILFFIGVIFGTFLPGKRTWLYALFSIVISILPSIIFEENLLFFSLLAIIHTLIVYRGVLYASHSWNSLLSISFLWLGGFTVYFMGYFVFRNATVLNPYLTHITVCGTILVIITMFIANSNHLKSSTLSKEKIPFVSRAIKSQNRLFLIMTVVVIVLITNARIIQDVLWNGLRAFIQLIVGSPTEEGTIITETPTEDIVDPTLPFEGPMEPSAFAKYSGIIVEYVAYAFVFLAAIALLLLFVKRARVLFKQIVRIVIIFFNKIVNRSAYSEESVQYVDEKERIFNWKRWKEEQQAHAKGFVQKVFKRKPSWKSLSNQQKVRFVYRQFLIQQLTNFTYKASSTPRETLAELKSSVPTDEEQVDKLRTAYEETRYGEQVIDDEKIEEIYTLMSKK